jgi:hypothetical protein
MNAGAAGVNGPQVGILGVKGIPYQGDQMAKIVEVLGTPERKRPRRPDPEIRQTDDPNFLCYAVERWPDIVHMPDYPQFASQSRYVGRVLELFRRADIQTDLFILQDASPNWQRGTAPGRDPKRDTSSLPNCSNSTP